MALEVLSKQPPVTLEEAREQVRQLKEWSKSKNKKKREHTGKSEKDQAD